MKHTQKNIFKKIVLATAVASTTLLLAGCPEGGGNSPTPAPTPAPTPTPVGFSISVYPPTDGFVAGQSAQVGVRLSPQLRSEFSSNPELSAVGKVVSISLTDSKGEINCDGPKNVTVGGGETIFNCTAPADYSDLGAHTLTAEGGGVESSPVQTRVIADNGVTATLLNPKPSYTPGESVKIRFTENSASPPPAVGIYTIQNPGGWTITPDNGECSISSTTKTCEMTLIIPSSQPNGQVKINIHSDPFSSKLTEDPNPIDLSITGSSTTTGTALSMKETGASLAMVYGTQYPVTYTFTNTSQSKITLTQQIQVNQSSPDSIKGLKVNVNSCTSGKELAASKGTCTITGTYDVASGSKATEENINFKADYHDEEANQTLSQTMGQRLVFVPKVEGYWPVRIDNLDPDYPLYVAVQGTLNNLDIQKQAFGSVIQFDPKTTYSNTNDSIDVFEQSNLTANPPENPTPSQIPYTGTLATNGFIACSQAQSYNSSNGTWTYVKADCPNETNSVKIPKASIGVLYIRHPFSINSIENQTFTGANIFMTYNQKMPNAFPGAPSTTNQALSVYKLRWGQVEFTLDQGQDSAGKDINEANTDVSAVNQASLPIQMSRVGVTDGQPIPSEGSATPLVNMDNFVSGLKNTYWDQIYNPSAGVNDPSKMQDFLGDIYTTVTSDNAPLTKLRQYYYNSSSSSFETNKSMLRINSPATVIRLPDGGAFSVPSGYFGSTTATNTGNKYNLNLWDYYNVNVGNHTLEVSVATEFPQGKGDCTQPYFGQVVEQSGQYSFVFRSKNTVNGTCGGAINTNLLPNPNGYTDEVVFSCSAATGGCNANTTGLPGVIDFFGAAPGGKDSILFAQNGTAKSVIGEAIAAAQSVGLMPYPSGEILSQDDIRNHIPAAQGGKGTAPVYFTNTQTNLLTGFARPYPMYNLYAAGVNTYYNTYGYGYGDFLGLAEDTTNPHVSVNPLTIQINNNCADPDTTTKADSYKCVNSPTN